ncbi:MAG: DUF4412 domain-containing protein [Desulfobacterota bacterium]|nr:DUF4412 domain-containing protein [Thermodesulfobacteriota bacterium]
MRGRILIFCSTIGILFFLFMIESAWSGLVIEEVHQDREGRMVKIIRSYSGHQFRTDHPEAGVSTIIDFEGDRLVMIDHGSRSYVEIKFSLWEREVAERLKRSVPRVRTRERRITVIRTGQRAVINGFKTEKIEVRADGELLEENWMTRDIDLGEVERVMERLARSFSKEFKREMEEGREIYEKLRPYGLPILTMDYQLTYGLGPIPVMEVKKIERKELGKDLFLPPPDYQRILPEPSKR